MIIRRKPGSTVTALRAPPASRMQSGRARAMRAAAFATAGQATVGLVLTGVFAWGASAGTQPSWTSGVYLPMGTPASVAGFGTWRGAPVKVATVWPNRSSWNDITNPSWLYQGWKGAPETVAFGVAMLPENVPGVSLQACAAGSYNSYWRQFGTNISAYGLGKSIIRLGWEFNGNWYVWQATNPTTWAACWQQIVTSARTTAPGLQWDWNVNRGVSAGLADPTLAYPGNAYVDTIGVDSYDMWPPATTSANWNQQLNGTQGLDYSARVREGARQEVRGARVGQRHARHRSDREPRGRGQPGVRERHARILPGQHSQPRLGVQLPGHHHRRDLRDWHTGAQGLSRLQGRILNRGQVPGAWGARGDLLDGHVVGR